MKKGAATAKTKKRQAPQSTRATRAKSSQPAAPALLDTAGKVIHGPLRVYSDGVYDLFHYGHMRMLEQVRRAFPEAVIIAGVCSDRDTHLHKGDTVFTMNERAESLRHCKWVDEVIPDAPWVITEAFINQHRIDYVAHDNAYLEPGQPDVYQTVKELGRFAITQRTQGISTTQLITRILHSYDKFLRRNIERGVSHQEMNISKFTANRIRLSRTVETNFSKLRGKLQDAADAWDKLSEHFIARFIGMFERR